MRTLVLAAVCACATAVVPPAPAATSGCSYSAARAAIRQTRPRLALIGEKVLITPQMADRVLCFDLTGDGRSELAVSLASGGTAGDVGWLLFAERRPGWRLASSGSGYKLTMLRRVRALEVVQPVYRRRDPNCCPSGGFDHVLYRWTGSALAADRTWHTAVFNR